MIRDEFQRPIYKVNQAWLLIFLTPLFFYVTHALAFFIHEYSHSFSAWIFGFKDNPLLLNYGDASWGNILFFNKIDENVNFQPFQATHPWIAAFIAFAGMGVETFCCFSFPSWRCYQESNMARYIIIFLFG